MKIFSVDLVTDGKCGQCSGCNRAPCKECSFCKNGDRGNCIDLYCTNDREGRAQRNAAREAYLLSIGVRQPEIETTENVYSSGKLF